MGDYANDPPQLLVGMAILRQRSQRLYRLLILLPALLPFVIGHVPISVSQPPGV